METHPAVWRPARDPSPALSWRPRWAAMALAMALLLVVYGCWQVFRLTPAHRPLVGDLFFYPVVCAGGWAAWHASRRCAPSPRLRSGWRFIALASVANFGAEIAQTVYEAEGHRPYPSIADVLFLTFYALMLCGLLRFSVVSRTVGERARMAIDLAV